MDRRDSLSAILGRPGHTGPRNPKTSGLSNRPFSGINPYTGQWTKVHAAHLLRRTIFGPTKSQIEAAFSLGLDLTVQQLLAAYPLPDPPVNPNNNNDPFVPIGSSWVNAPYLVGTNLVNYRNVSLRAWNWGLLVGENNMSIREKMTLFWHNHFAINNINDPKFVYRYITMLRSDALGNFRQLVKNVTIDPAMLRFLNGNQNTRSAPNENFARELMELFTLGKGPLAGPGDYTHFTETDVVQMSRVLTGWRDRGFNTTNPDIPVDAVFLPNLHDNGSKTLSHRFNNQVIPNLGSNEYAHLVDVIFQQEEVARFISRKLYRWFVYYDISPSVESEIIEPMAQILIASNYEIRPVMEVLLRSAHFFDALHMGAMIKSPVDFVAGAFKQFNIGYSPLLARRYAAWIAFHRLTIPMQMEYFMPPDVAGWKAYYQEPTYYRTWINAATLSPRSRFIDTFAGNGFVINTVNHTINALALPQLVSDPTDPVVLVRELSSLLFPLPLASNQLAYLKEVLLPGLPDYEWTIEYSDFLNNPNNAALNDAVTSKLRSLIRAMLQMPEYQLI
jgi:uncharacterized protein (DUF1800 family)